MAERDIFVTREDYDQLERLVRGPRQRGRKDLAHLDDLEGELDRAQVVESNAIPPDVVTMNSEVALTDLDTHAEIVLTVVFPRDADADHGKVSVLAPLGTAVLGYRAGDVIEWNVPGGLRRLRVERVLYQPEAANRSQ